MKGPAVAAGPFVRYAFPAAGLLCLLVSIGIFESQVTIMYFDKSIDATWLVLATFLSALLAPVIGVVFGPRRALVLTTLALGAGTAAAALVRSQEVELIASTVACIAGLWWLSLLVSVASGDDLRRDVTAGTAFALGILVVARAALRTEPSDEIPLGLAIGLLVVLLALLATGLRAILADELVWATANGRGVLGLFALPFALTLAGDVTLNGAFVGGAAGLATVGDSKSSYVGLLASGAGVAAALLILRTRYASGAFAAVALFAGAGLLWTRIGLAPLAGGAALAFGTVLASFVLVPRVRTGARAPVLIPLALGAGWVVSAIGSLAYYIGVGLVTVLAAMVAVVAIACVLSRTRVDAPSRRAAYALAALVVAVPVIAIASTPGPRSVGTAGRLRVMTYNIHLGYDDGNVPAIDAIGDAIAREAPDVVGLEEVSRGTVIAGGHDVLALLAERLHMSYAFAPMLGDVEGVGVLSRLPIEEVRVVRLARSTTAKDLTRVLLMVRTGGVWFCATHLGGDDFPTQTRSIVDAVRGLDRVVVSGDMNSTPDTPQMRVFADAGFADLGAAAGAPTIPVADPKDRIDYLWVSGVTGANVVTPRTSASDHLPVAADVAVR